MSAKNAVSASGPCVLYDAKQLASRLQVSVDMIWKMRRDGQLPDAIRVGRCVRWRPSDLDKWEARGGTSQGPRRKVVCSNG